VRKEGEPIYAGWVTEKPLFLILLRILDQELVRIGVTISED